MDWLYQYLMFLDGSWHKNPPQKKKPIPPNFPMALWHPSDTVFIFLHHADKGSCAFGRWGDLRVLVTLLDP